MFGYELSEISFSLSLIVSFAAGTLSFLSPCVLPIVPPYLAFMAGSSISNVKSSSVFSTNTSWLFSIATSFVFGLSTVFVILGLTAAAIGSFLFKFQSEMNFVSGVVVFIFGLHFLGILRLSIFNREYRLNLGTAGGGLMGAYLLGIAFAFGWTPCIGPVLGAILSMAAQSESLGRGAMLMAFYAAGLGLPFIVTGTFFARAIDVFAPLKRNAPTIEKIMGLLLVVVGILLFTGGFSSISFLLLEYFPILTTLG